jgi:ribokinase
VTDNEEANSRTGRVVVAGSINMDIVVTSPHYPGLGETTMGDAVARFPGGKGSNQAVAAAGAGAPTEFIGAVGDDGEGMELRAFLDERGVGVNALRSIPGTDSGIAIVVVAEGDNAVVVVSGANAHVDPNAVESASIGPGDVLVSQFEIAEATISAFFERGKANGARTILNPSPSRDFADELWTLSDVIVVNEVEFGFLCSRRHIAGGFAQLLDSVGSLIEREDQAVVVTLGPEGCVVVSRQQAVRIPGRPVHVVDTTGAGDCFLGYMAGRLVLDDGLVAAAEQANIASSLCVQRMGAGTSMPTATEVAAAPAG